MALADTNLKQGEDLALEIPVQDENNTNFSLDAATDIIAAILVNNAVVTKYSLNAQVGYGDLSLKAGVGNEHVAILQIKRSQSTNFPTGLMKISILVDQPDALLTEKRDEFTFDAGQVAAGSLKDESI